jgi:ABC-type sugar transport system permease subunit
MLEAIAFLSFILHKYTDLAVVLALLVTNAVITFLQEQRASSAVAALRSFDYVMIMTLGGPVNSSKVLAFYMYEETFVALRYGYGAAIATVLLALMSGIILLLLWRMFRRESP